MKNQRRLLALEINTVFIHFVLTLILVPLILDPSSPWMAFSDLEHSRSQNTIHKCR